MLKLEDAIRVDRRHVVIDDHSDSSLNLSQPASLLTAGNPDYSINFGCMITYINARNRLFSVIFGK